MWSLLRHLLSIAVLPGTVAVLVPMRLARRYGVSWHAPTNPRQAILQLLGVALLAAGLVLFGSSLARFATKGRGTLAPWDPPRHFVVDGPYRYVRNPMISGVILVLWGEALLLLSLPHAAWAVAFWALNLVYIRLIEERQLEARFGDEYRRYRKHVPRFLPRLRPWSPEEDRG